MQSFRFAPIVCIALGLWAVPQCSLYAQDLPTPPKDSLVVYTYSNAAVPEKRVLCTHTDSAMYFIRGPKAKLVRYPLTEDTTLASFYKLIGAQPKVKLTPTDALFLREAQLTWFSIRMSLGFEYTPSGLGYKITELGTGKKPEAGKTVAVHYRGYLENGSEFDNSFKRGEPISFELGIGRVIKGWDEGIQLFPVGSKGTLRIPSDLGYGARGAGGSIPPNATLFFDIEVVSAD
jgi:FKBP-type peptidyl-prolyl cis-trans isomerase